MTVSLSCSGLRLGLITFCCTDLIVSMTETEYTVSEADGLVSVCVELEQGTLDGETISVFLSTSNGSASPMSKNRTSFSLSLSMMTSHVTVLCPSVDFEVVESGSVPLGPSAATGSMWCLDISITDDEVAEPVQSFSVAMVAASETVTLGYPRSSSVVITNDDSECLCIANTSHLSLSLSLSLCSGHCVIIGFSVFS